MKNNITKYATVIRSKNSGPFELTLDIIFKDRVSFDLWKKSKIISEKKMAALYGIKIEDVL